MKKMRKWKRILTVLCISAMLLGIMNPSAIYAGESTEETASTQTGTAESAQTQTENAETDGTTVSGNAGSFSESANSDISGGSESGTETNAASGLSSQTPAGESGADIEDHSASEDSTETASDSRIMSVQRAAASGSGAVTPSAASDSESTGIDLEAAGTKYLTDYQISYRDGNDWKVITDSTTVPAYTTLRLTVYFGGISATELIKKGGLLYLNVPSLLQNPAVSSGNVTDNDGNKIGTITVSDNRINLQADINYLQKQLEEEKKDYTIENGQLTFTATPDPAMVRESSTQTLNLGPLKITISFDPDSDAKSGSLSLSKPAPEYISDTDGTAYLKYSLTVATGDAPMPDVTVTDHFTANANAVDSYVGISSTALQLASSEQTGNPYQHYENRDSSSAAGTVSLSVDRTASDPGTMLWTIGDMAANTTRTLYYYVKLKPDYVGAVSAGSGTITNTATPKSRTYEHNTVSSTFTPKSAATISKKAGTVVENSDNTVTIPYTITVTADGKNTWNLKNVKISDDFGVTDTNISRSAVWDAITRTDELQNLGFSNFKMISDGKEVEVNSGTRGNSEPPFYYIKGTDENPGFNFYLGDLEPGETKTVTFDVTMKPIFSSAAVTIGNRASAYTNDNSSFGNKQLAASSAQSTLEKQHWDRKIVALVTEDDIKQEPESAYIYSDTAWRESSSADKITVPAGSFKYQVVVNENGKWDVSSAAFADTLTDGGKYLQYSGYLEVKYYKNGIDASISSGTDQSVVQALMAKTEDKVLYFNIDGMSSFSLVPHVLESSLGSGAYLLTYYAKPISGNFSKETAGNSFSLSGTIIGTGKVRFTLPSMQVKVNVTVTGNEDYSVNKEGWYYDSADTSDGFTNGKLYWVITIRGSQIPAGMQLYDAPQNQPNHTLDTSIAGIYFGTPAEDGSSFTDNYAYYSQIKGNSGFTQLKSDLYEWVSNKTSGAGILTFNNNIEIPDGKVMYIILMTVPNKPWDVRTQKIFNNKLQEHSSADNKWQDVNTASLTALGSGTNFKEVGEYGSYDSTTGSWTYDTTKYSSNNPAKKILSSYDFGSGTESLQSGTYIDYRLIVNYAGDESGSFRVEDVVPDGMEPVYVRYFWIPKEIRNSDNAPTMPAIENLPAGEWTDIGLKTASLDNASGTKYSAFAYYDKASHRIIYDVGNLKKGSLDKQDLQVQIVMRVTDAETLLGKITTYKNTMNTYRTDGTLVSTSSTNTSIKVDSISKSKGTVSMGSVPFTITVNPRGEDLLQDSDTLTLVDELSGTMTVDPSSITITDRNGNQLPSNQWKISITKGTDSNSNTLTTMTLVIPDGEKLTIHYNASIDAPPNTAVTYRNTAYWYGYKGDSSSFVSDTVSYKADGSFGIGAKPQISLVKADKNTITTELAGAEFAIYLGKYDSTEKKWVPEGDPIETKKTGASGSHTGVLTFGSDKELLFNTVYCIVETKAPAGYVMDSNPIPVVIARKAKNGDYPNQSVDWGSTSGETKLVTHTAKDLETWAAQGVNINYRGSMFTYTVYNEKTSLTINKSFTDPDGKSITAPAGTFSFGLYSTNGSAVGEKLETLTITYDSQGKTTYKLTAGNLTQTVASPVFTDLNVGDSYQVYELDADGDPVEDNHILYNKESNGYIVTYPKGNQITAPDRTTTSEMNIINQSYTSPHTGIRPDHSDLYRGIAAVLSAVLAGFIYIRKRKKNRRTL